MKVRNIVLGGSLIALGCVMGLVIAGGGPSSGRSLATSPAHAQSGTYTAFGNSARRPSAQSSIRSLSYAFIAAARTVTPAVVTIRSKQTVTRGSTHPAVPGLPRGFFRNPGRRFERRGLGSGILVSADGYVLTNNHVVEGATDLKVIVGDGVEYDGVVIGTDPNTDIAVLKIDASALPFISFGDSDSVEVGQWVLAVGSPFGEKLQHTVTHGIVSAVGRDIGLINAGSRYGGFEDFIQTDAAINPGNSGGPLVDLDGRLIGINTAISSNTGSNAGVGFAIPVNLARSIMNQLVSGGRVVRGWLGVVINDLNATTAEALGLSSRDGSVVISVSVGSPAERGGLKAGDVILEVGGTHIGDSRDLRFKIAGEPPGSEVDVQVWRKGRTKRLQVTLGELPSEYQPASSGVASRSQFLGMTLENLTTSSRQRHGHEGRRGVLVTVVEPGSPAAQQDIRVGDLISEIQRSSVESVSEAARILGGAEVGQAVLLLLHRGDRTLFVGIRVPKE